MKSGDLVMLLDAHDSSIQVKVVAPIFQDFLIQFPKSCPTLKNCKPFFPTVESISQLYPNFTKTQAFEVINEIKHHYAEIGIPFTTEWKVLRSSSRFLMPCDVFEYLKDELNPQFSF